jgi:hypothetical protein
MKLVVPASAGAAVTPALLAKVRPPSFEKVA